MAGKRLGEILLEEDVLTKKQLQKALDIQKSGDTWIISGEGEGTFYNPYIDANMSGKIEFINLEIKTDETESPYFNYGGR